MASGQQGLMQKHSRTSQPHNPECLGALFLHHSLCVTCLPLTAADASKPSCWCKQLCVFVPASLLPCRAERVFERQVLPVLQDAAGMSVSSLVTSGPGAATELLSQLDLTAVDLLLFVGGDGTVYEGLQVSSHHQCVQSVSSRCAFAQGHSNACLSVPRLSVGAVL